MKRSPSANPESGNAPPGSKWGPARKSPSGAPEPRDERDERERESGRPPAATQPDAEEQGNFGETAGVEATSLETSPNVPGANRGG
jgi:hypothetical protein